MTLPKTVVQVATLGMENSPPLAEDTGSSVTSLIRERSIGNAQRQLLATVAGLKLQQLAGWIPPITHEKLNVPSVIEERDVCSREAMIHLLMMLDGKYKEFLPMWLRAMAEHNKIVPEEALPVLLDFGRKNKDLRELILPVLGRRGEWLAEMATRHDWLWFKPRNVKRRWEQGANATRIELIELLRESDPSQAREMIAEVWDKENKEIRMKLLAALKINLSVEDEEFIENALEDRTYDVRNLAIELLARLPESALRQRMQERALRCLVYDSKKRKPKLSVNFSAALDQDMERGIFKTIDKSILVRMILDFVDPLYLCEQWKITLNELFEAIYRNKEHSAMLWEKMVHSTIYLKNIEVANRLFSYLIDIGDSTLYGRALNNDLSSSGQAQYGKDWEELLELVSPDVKDQYVGKFIKNHATSIIAKHNILMSGIDGEWGEGLTTAFIENLLYVPDEWVEYRTINNTLEQYRQFATLIAESMIDQCLSLLNEDGISGDSKQHFLKDRKVASQSEFRSQMRRAVQNEFASYLEFRKRMMAAIKVN